MIQSTFPNLLLLLLLLLPSLTTSKRTIGSKDILQSWTFIDRFCFLPWNSAGCSLRNGCNPIAPTSAQVSKYGLFQYTINFPETIDLYMSVFYIEDNDENEESTSWDTAGWNAAYNQNPYKNQVVNDRHPGDGHLTTVMQATAANYTEMGMEGKSGYDKEMLNPEEVKTCAERFGLAATNFRLKELPGAVRKRTVSHKNIEVTGFSYFKSSSPKYFFVSFSNCSPLCASSNAGFTGHIPPVGSTDSSGYCDGPIIVDYDLTFTNGDGNSLHFSADEDGVYELSWVFLIFYTALLFLAYVNVKIPLKKEFKYHFTVKMLVASIWIMWISLACAIYHYWVYVQDGIGSVNMYIASRLLSSLSEVVLVTKLLLIAKGWTIVRRKISARGRVKIVVFTTLFLSLHLTMRYYITVSLDPAQVVYEYATTPGRVLLYAKMCAGIWFFRCVFTTIQEFPQKKSRFYRKFTIVFGMWFIWLCLLIFIAESIDDNVRAKFALAFELSLYFVSHFMLVFMYTPGISVSRAFPFHATSAEDMNGRERMKGVRMKASIGRSRRVREGKTKEEGYGFVRNSRNEKEGETGEGMEGIMGKPNSLGVLTAVEGGEEGKSNRKMSNAASGGGEVVLGGSDNVTKSRGLMIENYTVPLGSDGSEGYANEGFTPKALSSGTNLTADGHTNGNGNSSSNGRQQGTFHPPHPTNPNKTYTFKTTTEATLAVKVAGDDLSSILHSMLKNLDGLDDAMDDWEDDLNADDDGEAYEGMVDEDVHGNDFFGMNRNRGNGNIGGGGLPLHRAGNDASASTSTGGGGRTFVPPGSGVRGDVGGERLP